MIRFGRKVGNWGGLVRIVLVKCEWEGSYTDGTVIVLSGDWGSVLRGVSAAGLFVAFGCTWTCWGDRTGVVE